MSRRLELALARPGRELAASIAYASRVFSATARRVRSLVEGVERGLPGGEICGGRRRIERTIFAAARRRACSRLTRQLTLTSVPTGVYW